MSKTFDILDAAIPDAFETWQGFPDAVRFPAYRREFLVDPKNWALYLPENWVFELEWKEFVYSDVENSAALNKIMKQLDPGIYIFYVRPGRRLHHFPSFPMYVGISNRRDSGRPLRERIADYLPNRMRSRSKRDNIDLMLQLYYKSIVVAYAYTKKPSVELETAEKKIHGYIHPPFAIESFPTEIKRQQKAFGKR